MGFLLMGGGGAPPLHRIKPTAQLVCGWPGRRLWALMCICLYQCHHHPVIILDTCVSRIGRLSWVILCLYGRLHSHALRYSSS